MKNVYFDNNATTKVAPEVHEEMKPYFKEHYGNPSSMHSFGGRIEISVNEAREKTADLLNAHPDEIVFTSCGTEGNNTAINAALKSHPDKNHIVTTKVEHPAVRGPCRHFKGKGYELTELDVDKNGHLSLEELKDSIRDDTAIVSIMYANNETGMIFPIREIAEIVKSRGAVFHCDAVQAVGKIPIDLQKTPIDFLTLSGHKLHAPKGVGALYIRKGTKFSPFLIGGHQEKNRRAGTENVPYIVGLGKACELAQENLKEEQSKVKALRDRLKKGLTENIDKTLINGSLENCLANTLNISFEHVEGESILLLLDEKGIAASSGSACSSGSLEPSHVLRAMGVPFTFVHGSIRFSLSIYNTREEVDYVIDSMEEIIDKLRDISPYGTEEAKEQF